jgi:hypothetical protein
VVSARSALGAAVLLGGSAAACNAVLGITQASIDTTLSSDGGSHDGNASDGGEGGVTSICETYCATVDKNCTGDNQEYIDVGTCQQLCNQLEPGRLGEQTNDTRNCRLFYANAAATDPVAQCPRAGPLGISFGGVGCSQDRCQAFCSLSFAVCRAVVDPTGKAVNLFPYDAGDECHAACLKWPYLKATDPDAAAHTGDITFSTGNTLNCRVYHLGSAVEPGNPTAAFTHCPHLGDPSATCN